MKALIVEPSKLYQALYTKILSELDFTVVCAENGQQGFGRLDADDTDIVFSAMHLGDMSGASFCEQLRHNAAFAQLPVIMITATEDGKTLGAAISAGVTEIFQKDDLDRVADYMRAFVKDLQDDGQLAGAVLYTEDNKAVAALICALLSENGLNVDHYTTAEEALEAFKEGDYDLVLTDVVLAGHMNGYELVKALRSTQDHKSLVPILAVTGFDDTARRLELLRAGVNDYVTKPVIDEELLARVKNLITNKHLLDELERQKERMRQLAMTDQLTTLYNRHFLMEVGPQRISEAFRHRLQLSMIVADIDHFKAINDQHGHSMGDVVLKQVGETLRESCRTEDVAARFGGEEFVLLLAHCGQHDAEQKAEKLRCQLETLNPGGIPVTASFGVSSLPIEGNCDFPQLFNAADKAVYEAKSAGRNRVVIGQFG